jgi:arylsulfatase A
MERRPPNIVFIIADDLGYGDLSCYGQARFVTPNIDRLAKEGMTLPVHYAGNAVCAPSRAVLLTGLHPGHAPIRDNREIRSTGLPFPEGQQPLPAGTVTLPKLLQQAGYATGAFGKWGLGPVGSTGDPARMGIGRFYGYNCQAVAHNYYPTHLWDDDRRVKLDNPSFAVHQKLPDGTDPADPAAYARFTGKDYAPDLIAEQARRFVRENKDRPFFLFFPTTVPHLALQVPEEALKEFAGKFLETPYPGGRSYLPHRYPRAAYAAMVTRLDREVGRLLDLINELGLDRDTIFVFTSDNGPLYNQLGGTDTDFFRSAGELRGRKGSLYEGGVRVPCLVRWTGQIGPGTRNERVTGFEDWLPTLLELIGQRRRTPRRLDGISFAPTLRGARQRERARLYREHAGYGGQQFVRVGDWKLLRERVNLGPGDKRAVGALELYDLKTDPAETTDIATRHPERVAQMAALLNQEHTPSILFPMRALDGVERNQG